MRSIQISAHWTGEALNFAGTDTRGNEVLMGKSALSPSQMLLLGLAGCTGMDVVSILQKKRQQVTGVEVQVTAQQPDDYPRPYQVIEIAFNIQGKDIDPAAVARAIELSETKYCVAGQTLQNRVEIKTSFTVSG